MNKVTVYESLLFRKPKVLLAVLAGLLVSLVLAYVFVEKRSYIDDPILPEESEQFSVKATVFSPPEHPSVLPVLEFDVPAEYARTIVNFLRPPKRSSKLDNRKDVQIARLMIATKSGKKIEIAVFETGKTALCYSIDGVRYFRGGKYAPVRIGDDEEVYVDEAGLLVEVIFEIKKELDTKQRNERLGRFLEDMERTKGEKPPEQRGK